VNPRYEKLRAFLEDHPAAREAAKPLKTGAAIRIVLTDDGSEYTYTVRRGCPVFEPGKTLDPDVTLSVPPGAVDSLLSVTEQTVQGYGLRILELADTDDLTLKIRGAAHSGLGRLWRHGYFNYLWMGGRQFVAYLRRKGVGTISSIQERLHSARKPAD